MSGNLASHLQELLRPELRLEVRIWPLLPTLSRTVIPMVKLPSEVTVKIDVDASALTSALAKASATIHPIRPKAGFAVSFRRTRMPAAFKPWRRFWWQMLRGVWGRGIGAWGITGSPLRLGELPEYESVCVHFGPFVVVVDLPSRHNERAS